MTPDILIKRATGREAPEIAVMVGALLGEIMNILDTPVFNFDLEETSGRLKDYLDHEKYFVFLARTKNRDPVGFITLYESYALYAEGAFGTIPELYVKPPFRSHKIGRHLLSYAKAFGKSKGWTRLEVTTPPLPHFEKTLVFYEREDFEITGGRKLKVVL